MSSPLSAARFEAAQRRGAQVRAAQGYTEAAEAFIALSRDLQQVPQELRRQLGSQLRAAAAPIADDARGRASWSTRIPGAITTSARFTGKRPGVTIRVNRNKAPHGRAYEGISRGGGSFRHPVFGHRDRWVSQNARPFLAPAVQAGSERVFEAVTQAVDDSARLHGWR